MKTHDNRINYIELLKKWDDMFDYKRYELLEKFHYEFYKTGMKNRG